MSIHPCFADLNQKSSGWIHLPVAPACNIECRYCCRKLDHARPGALLSVDEATGSVQTLMDNGESVTGAAISGPGEPLANAATYAVLRRLNWKFPDLSLGISTNGLLLPERVEQLQTAGVRSISVTINAFSAETAKKIYSQILYRGRRYAIADSAEFLLKNQWQGLMLAVDAGMPVTVNTILIPDVNENDILEIARKAGNMGVRLMEINPLEPHAEFKDITPPDKETLALLQGRCSPFIAQAKI
jgi:nitrogen fixation protein NifB